jgi:hypothetical protein
MLLAKLNNKPQHSSNSPNIVQLSHFDVIHMELQS